VTLLGIEGRVADVGRTRVDSGDREKFPSATQVSFQKYSVAAVGSVRINYVDEGRDWTSFVFLANYSPCYIPPIIQRQRRGVINNRSIRYRVCRWRERESGV